MLNDFFQFIGFLTCCASLTWVVVKLVQRLDRWLTKKDLVKDAITKAKIEYKERNKKDGK